MLSILQAGFGAVESGESFGKSGEDEGDIESTMPVPSDAIVSLFTIYNYIIVESIQF